MKTIHKYLISAVMFIAATCMAVPATAACPPGMKVLGFILDCPVGYPTICVFNDISGDEMIDWWESMNEIFCP